MDERSKLALILDDIAAKEDFEDIIKYQNQQSY